MKNLGPAFDFFALDLLSRQNEIHPAAPPPSGWERNYAKAMVAAMVSDGVSFMGLSRLCHSLEHKPDLSSKKNNLTKKLQHVLSGLATNSMFFPVSFFSKNIIDLP